MSEKIKMRDGDTMLIMVKDGAVIHFTPNMGLPHVEFVRRATGELPEGAWVGTVSRLNGKVAAISSKHFFGYQLPGPDWVQAAVIERFELAPNGLTPSEPGLSTAVAIGASRVPGLSLGRGDY